MPPAKPGDTFMVELLMPHDVAACVMAHAMLQERQPNSPQLPSSARMRPDMRRFWSKFGGARYLVRAQGWKPTFGGITFIVNVPWQNERMRAVALFADQEVGRRILTQEATRKRGSAVLQEVDGVWYAHIRYSDYGRTTRAHRPSKEHQRKMRRLGIDIDAIRYYGKEEWFKARKKEPIKLRPIEGTTLPMSVVIPKGRTTRSRLRKA